MAEAVRQFPVLYDKSDPGHKDKNIIANAWKEVVSTCSEYVADENEAKTLFENLKKRYNKKKNIVKKADVR